MDLLSDLMLGAQAAFSAWNLAYCLLGVFLGTAIGVVTEGVMIYLIS